MGRIRKYCQSCHGATAIEYALIASGIAVACIGAIFLLGGDLASLFNAMVNQLGNVANRL